jgi:hypothetical protein
MKKILLLLLASCFFIVQTKIVFGKCNAICSFKRYSDSYSGQFSYNHVDTISISSGDTIAISYYLNTLGTCFDCMHYTLFYKDGILTQQDTLTWNGVLTIIILNSGLYELNVTCGHICTFQIISSPTGINDPSSLTSPYPLSKLPSNIDLNNLRYKIVNVMGQVVENGNFSGAIILRDAKPLNPLPAGIYFVIYYDALDNRQVLTDKVVIGRP